MRIDDEITSEKRPFRVRNGRKISLARIRTVIYTLAVALITGLQITHPNKRIIEAAAGAVLVAILWNFSTFAALAFIVVIYPFPFGIFVGNSTLVFVVVIFFLYLLRVTAKLNKFATDKAFNIPILMIMGSYIISFYSLETNMRIYRLAIIQTVSVFASIMLFYLIINFIDDEEKLKKMARVMMISAFLVILFTIIENLFPGRTIIPGWLYTRHKAQLIMKGIRMGGPFHDFELNAEFFALNAPIMFLLMIREKRMATRFLFLALLILNVFMMFTTITRGAFLTLFAGYMYMAILFRKDLDIVKFVMLSIATVAMVLVLDLIVSSYTVSGSVIQRLFSSTFTKGVVPENRTAAWFSSVDRFLKSPIIGHGPAWDIEKKGSDFLLYPHSLYLYILNVSGIIGFLSFLFFIFRLIKASLKSIGASITSSPFSEAFLKVLHVILMMFLFDQIKIEYLRNEIYMYFVWMLFGTIVAAKNVVIKNGKERQEAVPS